MNEAEIIQKVKNRLSHNRDIPLGPKGRKYPGRLIVMEGDDGAGKTTISKRLVDDLRECDVKASYVRTPGGTFLSEEIRDILLNVETPLSNRTEALLFAAQLADCVDKVIQPMLRDGEIVVCDRLIFSPYAYQAVGRGLSFKLITDLNSEALTGIWPDFGIMLYNPNPPEKDKNDRFESAGGEFSLKVKTYYDNILEMNTSAAELMHRITLNIDPDVTFVEVWGHVKNKLNL